MLIIRLDFYLNRNKVMLSVRNKTNRFWINTGIKIEEKFWDVTKQKPKVSFSSYKETSKYLENFKVRIDKFSKEIISENFDISFENFKEILLSKISDKPKHNFIEVFDLFLSDKKTKNSAGTFKKYRTIKSHLLSFSESEKFNLRFDKIDLTFFDKFNRYLISKNFADNYVRKITMVIKEFLNWSFEREYHSTEKFKKIKLNKESQTDLIALTKLELQKIIEIELPENLSKVRDCFLFGCYTGQGYTEISNFDIMDVENGIWYIRRQKTLHHKKQANKVVLIQPALEILDKYNYKLPLLTNQKMNQYLKEIGKIAGINDDYKITKFVANKEINEVKKRYELLTTHTARRTFVSLSQYTGLSNDIIKSYTGHSSDKMVSKYFKSDITETKKLMESVFTATN